MTSQERPFDFDAFRRHIDDLYRFADLRYVVEQQHERAPIETRVIHSVTAGQLDTAVRRGLLTPGEAERYRRGTTAEALEVIEAAERRFSHSVRSSDHDERCRPAAAAKS